MCSNVLTNDKQDSMVNNAQPSAHRFLVMSIQDLKKLVGEQLSQELLPKTDLEYVLLDGMHRMLVVWSDAEMIKKYNVSINCFFTMFN